LKNSDIYEYNRNKFLMEVNSMFSFDEITKVDPEVAAAMTDEFNRQNNNLELIASENIVSKAVMAAMGSHLTNKYAEGISW